MDVYAQRHHLQRQKSVSMFLLGYCIFGVLPCYFCVVGSGFLCSAILCSGFSSLGSMALWVIDGDRVQLGPIVISSGFREAAPKR